MNPKLKRLVLSSLFLALALILPLLTANLPQMGSAFCPMHIPVLLCGFLCGPCWGAVVGFIAPLLRFLIFGAPPLIPTGVAMSLELAAYGFISGLVYRVLPRRRGSVYLALIIAMLAGRVVWGAARVVLFGLGSSAFSWHAFLTGAFVTAAPGIVIQLVLVPVLVMTLERQK